MVGIVVSRVNNWDHLAEQDAEDVAVDGKGEKTLSDSSRAPISFLAA